MLKEKQISALLTDATLRKIASGIRDNIRIAIRDDASKAFFDTKINSIVRIAQFFGQILKETGGLKRLDESSRLCVALENRSHLRVAGCPRSAAQGLR